jgi:predicted dehydrogenase
VRIAIVGCGRAARQHVEAIALAGTGSVVAVVDEQASRADGLARLIGATARSLEHVLEDACIDVTAVCTPPDTHASIAVAALQAGKGVLVEKPVVRTSQELDAILAASETSTAPVVAMLQHRGRLPAAALTSPWTTDASAVIEVVRPRARDHYLAAPWRHNPDVSGGGHVAHLAVHHLDLACQLLGMPTKVIGLTDCRDFCGIETRAAFAAQFVSGALMTVLASAHPGRRCERLHVVDGQRELLIVDAGTEYRADGTVEHWQPVPTAQLRAYVYAELLAAVRGEAAPDRYAVQRARGVTALLEEIRRLAATQEPAT